MSFKPQVIADRFWQVVSKRLALCQPAKRLKQTPKI